MYRQLVLLVLGIDVLCNLSCKSLISVMVQERTSGAKVAFVLSTPRRLFQPDVQVDATQVVI